MPVHPLFPTKEVRTSKFAYFLNPSDLPKETQAWIVKTIGSSANGLNITEAEVLKDLETENLSAYTFVWNSPTDLNHDSSLVEQAEIESGDFCHHLQLCSPSSWAFGSLQYYDWLETGEPQLWITDVCRIGTRDSTQPSPIQGLLKLLTTIAIQYQIDDVWLMVDEGASSEKLQSLYEGYGFQRQGVHAALNVYMMQKSINP
jgi:hypothetical protein